jgi:hypothetical protein
MVAALQRDPKKIGRPKVYFFDSLLQPLAYKTRLLCFLENQSEQITMSLTKRQSAIISDIRGGIAFLKKEYPKKNEFLIGQVFAHAGIDNKGTNLYSVIKVLRKKNQIEELSSLRELFLSVGIKLRPLEKWSKDRVVMKEKTEELKDSYIRRFEMTEKERVELEMKSKHSVLDSNVGNDIESLSEILKILAPLSQDKRESLLSSAESFFSMGT